MRTFSEIGREIREKWPNVGLYARPYLNAMCHIDSSDKSARFGLDDAESVVLYFLSNAQGWRGEDARRIKKELNAMIR